MAQICHSTKMEKWHISVTPCINFSFTVTRQLQSAEPTDYESVFDLTLFILISHLQRMPRVKTNVTQWHQMTRP